MRRIAFFLIALIVLLLIHSTQEKACSAEELYNSGYLLPLVGASELTLRLCDESLALLPNAGGA
jgi:hypothetical protein